jgi:succinate dehydrogenase / fumarate reductase cytochrome b subunit
MAASIFHRVTGVGLSLIGLAVLTWWLFVIAKGQDAYLGFSKLAASPIGLIVLIGLTWAFFQHLLSGIRHLVTDTGANFELGPNKASAILTFVGAVVLTAAVWIYIFFGAHA